MRAQAQRRFTPILMLTTESGDARKAEGKAAGATGWIVKPFHPEQLLKVIEKVLPRDVRPPSRPTQRRRGDEHRHHDLPSGVFRRSRGTAGRHGGLLLRLEETPDDRELLNTIFRCAHSIKGGSATFGFTDIAHFTHGLETLLDRCATARSTVDQPLTQLLLESQDQLKALLAVARGEARARRTPPR